VSDTLREFVSWASKWLQKPTLADSQIELVIGRSSPNRAAHLTIETERLIGRLIFWEDGSAHAAVSEVDDNPPTKNWNWAAIDIRRFDSTFRPFVREFFAEDKSG
jgi:hypothetical protein